MEKIHNLQTNRDSFTISCNIESQFLHHYLQLMEESFEYYKKIIKAVEDGTIYSEDADSLMEGVFNDLKTSYDNITQNYGPNYYRELADSKGKSK